MSRSRSFFLEKYSIFLAAASGIDCPAGGGKAIHLEYLSELANAAWADCRISESERREIQLAAQLLGFGRLSDDSTTYCAPARATSVPIQL
jgi:hypothetical protein